MLKTNTHSVPGGQTVAVQLQWTQWASRNVLSRRFRNQPVTKAVMQEVCALTRDWLTRDGTNTTSYHTNHNTGRHTRDIVVKQ